MRNLIILLPLFALFTLAPSVLAEDTVYKTVGSPAANGIEKVAAELPSPDSAKPDSETIFPDSQQQDLASGAVMPTKGAVERAVLHYRPDVLDDEGWLRKEVEALYPDEAGSFENDDVAWQKSKDDFKARIVAEVKNPPLTFEVNPWTPGAYGGAIAFGTYDSTRNAFFVRMVNIEFPIGYDMRQLSMRLNKTIRSVPVVPDIADKLVKSRAFNASGRRLYAQFKYTISDVRQYEHKGNVDLRPVVDIKEIKLYQRLNNGPSVDNSKGDYDYITSVFLRGPGYDAAIEKN